MSSRGYDLSLYGQLNPGPGYGETFSFNVDGSLTAAMDGGLIDNRDAADEIELTFPQAVEGYTFAVRQVEDYPIKMLPYAGDTILGETDGYSIHSGEIVVFTVNDTGDWEIVTGGAPNIISPTYNVKRYGARGDGSTDDTVAFQTAMSKCTTRGSVVLVPETDDGALPGYVISQNVFASLGTISDAYPGTVMELGGRLLTSVQQIIPGATRVIGKTSNNNAVTGGSSIRATASFPNNGTAIVRIGRPVGATGYAGSADEAADGSKLEWVTINGAGRSAVGNLVVGVYSSSMQERSGLENCIVMNVLNGVVTAAGTGITPANFMLRNVDAWVYPSATGYGFKLSGGKFTLEKATVVTTNSAGYVVTGAANNGSGLVRLTVTSHPFVNGQRVKVASVGGTTEANGTWLVSGATSTTIDLAAAPVASGGSGSDSAYANAYTSGGVVYANCFAGFGFSGQDIRAENLHVERVEYGVDIAWDNPNFWTYGVLADGVHGYNNSTHPLMLALGRVRAIEDRVFDVELRRFNVNTPNGQVVMILDERNNVTIPMAEFHASYDVSLGKYRFGGTAENGAVATPIPVECDRFEQTVEVSIAGGTTQDDYDIARAGRLIVTVTGAGDVTFTSFANGFLGRDFEIVNDGASVGNVILDHAAGTGTAANRIESGYVSGGVLADITLIPGQAAVVRGKRGPTDGRWFAVKL